MQSLDGSQKLGLIPKIQTIGTFPQAKEQIIVTAADIVFIPIESKHWLATFAKDTATLGQNQCLTIFWSRAYP
jgi:hypothetical protein